MLFHMRQFNGGTMLVHNGTPKKLDLKTDSTISAGVYPSWHPTADLVAFSTNTTRQTFHPKDKDKIEVLDYASDLILYDVAKNEVSTISNAKDELECFPTWSPDGKTLYYTSAHISSPDSISTENYFKRHFREIKYNIYSRSFDLATHKFGEPQLVFDAASLNKSATLPRVSPDGKYITFALGSYGCFHVWHRDADICVIETPQPLPSTSTLNTKPSTLNTTPLNSPFSESYPSFSSNGRWIMTASRRDDGNYTRPYIAYFDASGKCHKAFEIPQQDPERNTLLLRSYNRPEFMKQRVKITPQQFATKAQENAVHAKYIKK
jgi:Tol biopolymer transport system component